MNQVLFDVISLQSLGIRRRARTAMPARNQFTTCIAIVTVLLIQLGAAQNRIVFPDEDYDLTENRFFVPYVRIPENLLMQLNNVHNMTEFLKKFVKPEENVIEHKGVVRFSSSGRKATPRRKTNTNNPPVVYAESAKCKPEWQVVHIQQPADGASLRWPNCIRVKRCGGCCWGNLITCVPLQVSYVNVTVTEAYYDPMIDPDRFQESKPVVISIEHHTKCACRCAQSPETCGELQEFDENCRCVCKNRKLASKCTQHRVWNDSECTCKCRERLQCSTGRSFNEEKCKCELMK